jgi:hypothetical protein
MKWSPDGRRLLLLWGNALSTYNLETGEERWFGDGTRGLVGGSWNARGDSILYTREKVGALESPDSIGLYVASAEGSYERPFLLADGTRIMPMGSVSISPDGEAMVYLEPSMDDNGGYVQGGEIYYVRMDGTGKRQLTNWGGMAREPVWIEGGRVIAFAYSSIDCWYSDRLIGHTWAIDAGFWVPYRYWTDIADRTVQFCWPPGVDTSRWSVAATYHEQGSEFGELFVLDLRLKKWRPLFAPRVERSAALEVMKRVGAARSTASGAP